MKSIEEIYVIRGNKLKVNEEIKRSWGEGSIAHDLLDAILNED